MELNQSELFNKYLINYNAHKLVLTSVFSGNCDDSLLEALEQYRRENKPLIVGLIDDNYTVYLTEYPEFYFVEKLKKKGWKENKFNTLRVFTKGNSVIDFIHHNDGKLNLVIVIDYVNNISLAPRVFDDIVK